MNKEFLSYVYDAPRRLGKSLFLLIKVWIILVGMDAVIHYYLTTNGIIDDDLRVLQEGTFNEVFFSIAFSYMPYFLNIILFYYFIFVIFNSGAMSSIHNMDVIKSLKLNFGKIIRLSLITYFAIIIIAQIVIGFTYRLSHSSFAMQNPNVIEFLLYFHDKILGIILYFVLVFSIAEVIMKKKSLLKILYDLFTKYFSKCLAALLFLLILSFIPDLYFNSLDLSLLDDESAPFLMLIANLFAILILASLYVLLSIFCQIFASAIVVYRVKKTQND